MYPLTKFSEGVNKIRKFLGGSVPLKKFSQGVRKIYKISEGVFLARSLVNRYFYGGAQNTSQLVKKTETLLVVGGPSRCVGSHKGYREKNIMMATGNRCEVKLQYGYITIKNAI